MTATSRHDHHATLAVLAGLMLGCVGEPRVGILPAMGGASPRNDPVRPIEDQAIAPVQRDTSASLAEYDTGLAQGQLALTTALVRLFAGATAPIMGGVFGLFDEDRLFDRTGQLSRRARPEQAAKKRPDRCAAFLCGPVTRPR